MPDSVAEQLDGLHDLARAALNVLDHLSRLTNHFDAEVGFAQTFLHALDSDLGEIVVSLYHLLDLRCRLSGSHCQLANLVCYNGKTPAVLSRTGGFDRRIQSQEVCLLGDLAYRLNDPGDGFRLGVDCLNLLCGFESSSAISRTVAMVWRTMFAPSLALRSVLWAIS